MDGAGGSGAKSLCKLLKVQSMHLFENRRKKKVTDYKKGKEEEGEKKKQKYKK